MAERNGLVDRLVALKDNLDGMKIEDARTDKGLEIHICPVIYTSRGNTDKELGVKIRWDVYHVTNDPNNSLIDERASKLFREGVESHFSSPEERYSTNYDYSLVGSNAVYIGVVDRFIDEELELLKTNPNLHKDEELTFMPNF